MAKDQLEQTLIWKEAIKIYAEIAELSVEGALSHLNKIDNLVSEIKQAVITLINSGNQASVYIKKNFTPDFNALSYDIPDYEIGFVLGEYELLEKLGHGGMSQVYKAKRIESEPQKQVAIKIFSPKGHSLLLLENFINEQKILSELSHPNIVDMLHGGKTDDNTTYLVMELIEKAMPINQYFKNQTKTIDKKIAYINLCAKALSYSHANLIIHRDLKPDNILVDQNNKLKIVDFGIAKLINNDIVGNKTTLMALTPSYAAPEQINSGNISVTTDIFSLAVVALELLAGKQFLPKDRLIKSCVNDEQAIDACLKFLKIDKDLKNILRHALQQNPLKRYASMQSFADDLDNYLNHQPVNATSQSIYYRMEKFARRRSALFVSMVSLLVSLILGLAITLWQYQQIKIESGKAQQVKQFMLDTFNVTDPNVSGGNNVSAKDLLRIAAVKLNGNNSMNAMIKFELYQSLAIANDQLGFSQAAISLLKQSLKINPQSTKSIAYLAQNYLRANEIQALTELLSKTKEAMFSSFSDRIKFSLVRAKSLSVNGFSKQAIDLIINLKSLKYLKTNDHELVIIQQVLAAIYYEQSEYIQSINILKSILSESKLAATNTLILSIRLDLSRSYNTMGEHDLAMAELNKIEAFYKQILGHKHPDLGVLYLTMASSFRAKGEHTKSQEYAQLSYDTNISIFGNKGTQVANSLNMLAILAETNGDVEKAIDLTDKAINLLEQSYVSNHPIILEYKTNLATLFGYNNQHQKALDILNGVYQLQIKQSGINNYTTIHTNSTIIAALIKLKRTEQAKELALKHLDRVQNHVNPKKQKIAGAYYLLSKIYVNTKEHNKRLEALLEIERQNLFGKSDPQFVVALFTIAQSYDKVDNIDMAKKYFKKAFKLNAHIYSETHISTLQMKSLYALFLTKHQQYKEANKILLEVKQVVQQEGYNNIQLNKWIKQLARIFLRNAEF